MQYDVQCLTKCCEFVSRHGVYVLCVLRLCFNLFHYFLLEVGVSEVITVIDNLVFLKFRLQLTFPLRHIICISPSPHFINVSVKYRIQ